ncbi:MAG: FAD-dependent monooxygenase [Alphaproteobacteria bacterium]
MAQEHSECDVIIVGGGPVGLGLALDLTLGGASVRVLERSTSLHSIPKGQNLTQRSGEHFRRWGIGEDVRRASPIPRSFGNAGIVTWGRLLDTYSYDWFVRAKVGAYYFAENERLPQYRLERVLRDRLEQLAPGTLVTGSKVVDLAQDENAVTVKFEDAETGLAQEARASFVVGCDGARSPVRNLAGIEQATDHSGPKMALLVFRSMELDRLLQCYPGKSIYNVVNPAMEGYWQFLGRVDLEGGWFYHAPVPANATVDDYDFRTHLHEMVGQPFDLEFEHIGFWDLRISHAKTYQSHRVFIAGDAGHSHPPYGGYGVNTGLEDARNLSWKILATVKGWAGRSLLASYTPERHPVFASTAQDFIERMILDFRTFCAEFAPDKDQQKFEAAWQERAEGGDADVTQFLPHYAGSPLIWGQSDAQSGAKGVHTFTAVPGHHLAPPPAKNRSLEPELWSAMASGFVLLNLDGQTMRAKEFEDAAQARGVPLQVLNQNDEDLQSHYGCRAILVRPDQFVAWTDAVTEQNANTILARAVGARDDE